MKKLLISAMLTISAMAWSATPNDTIAVTLSDVSKWEAVEGVNTKGAKTIKYYCIYKGLLVSTTKTTSEKAILCKKLGAKCALICIGKKSKTGFLPKRIVAVN